MRTNRKNEHLILMLRANGRNNSQHSWTNNVGSCCVRVGCAVQMNAPTSNNIGTCSESWEGYNLYGDHGNARVAPTMLEELKGRAVQTDLRLLRYASAITGQKLLSQNFDRFQTLPTTPNNTQQHATGCAKRSNNVASICTGL